MSALKTNRRDLLRLRFLRHGLGSAPGSRRRATDVELLDYGVQDTGPDGATWALLVRGAPEPDDGGLALAWTLRGAPHAYRRDDLGAIAAATAPYSEGDAAKRIFDASKPLKDAEIPVLDALTVVADAERKIVTKPTVKGELSTALTKALDDPYLRWCNPCQATHAHEQPFRLAALQAGLELEAGTSPPVLRRIKGLKAPRFRRLADSAEPRHDVIRNHLRFYPGARLRDVAEFVDAPIKDVKAHWPDDAEEITVSGVGEGKKDDARYVLADDVGALGEVEPSDRVVLVGTYDPYVQLRDRELLTTDPGRRKALWPQIGRPGTILVDGEVLATWRPKTAKGALTVNVDPWKRVSAKQREQIEAEAERLVVFRGVDLAGVAYARAQPDVYPDAPPDSIDRVDLASDEPPTLTIEAEPERADDVVRLFIAWADADEVRVAFTPDVLIAVDTPDRAGWLLDEIYWVTVAIDRGGSAFRQAIEDALPHDTWRAVAAEPHRDALRAWTIRDGHRLAEVRHLL